MRNDFESNYLEHSILKGYKRKNHKYFERIERNGRYIYFYTQAAYDAFMRKASGAAKSLKNSLSSQKQNANKEIVTNLQKKNRAAKTNTIQNSLSTGQARIEKLRQQNFSAPGKTSEEKKKNTEAAISKGEEEIKKALSSSEDKKSSKGSGSSSKSSSGKSGKKSKGSSAKKESAAKEKSASSKKAATAKEKKTATKETTKKTEKVKDNTPINLDALKKIYGKKDEDVATHTTPSEFENEMLSKYDEGSFGYLMAGDKAYKWTIEGGKLIIKDFDTDKEVTSKDYLNNVKEFKEFQTSKKHKSYK